MFRIKETARDPDWRSAGSAFVDGSALRSSSGEKKGIKSRTWTDR
jgi:hypothetical protein